MAWRFEAQLMSEFVQSIQVECAEVSCKSYGYPWMLALGRSATCNVPMIRDVPRHHPLLVQFRDDPYPLYRYLLAAAPVQRNELLEAWTVARHSDVVTVLTDPRFSADRTGISPEGYEV